MLKKNVLLILVFFLFTVYISYALASHNLNIDQIDKSDQIIRNIGEPIELNQIILAHIQETPTKNQLLQALISLRDRARYL